MAQKTAEEATGGDGRLTIRQAMDGEVSMQWDCFFFKIDLTYSFS